MAITLVVDTDPGIDDVVALALALRSPEVRLAAVTTSYGNATLAATTRNARHLARLLDRPEVPILPGSDRPMRRQLVTAPETHGPTGVGGAPVPAAHPVAANPLVLVDALKRCDSAVVLVTLGPLTNLAHALASDPELVRSRVERHIGMFGNIHERGNTNRWADFNAWADPEATAVVLQAALPTEMVGLDVTRQMTFDAAFVDTLAGAPDPLVAWLGAALQFYVRFHRSQERLDGCIVNDVLPIGEILAPGLLGYDDLPLTVAQEEGENRGRTAVDTRGALTRVAMRVDIPTMRVLLARVFAAGSETSRPQERAKQ